MVVKTQTESPEKRRAGVFISHSRKDKDFVRHLAEVLEKSDHKAWVDVESITPTAEFWPEVYSGIEGTDAFVFVISPDSVRSEDCQEELVHAVEHNKRLVPIVYREVDDEDVPEPLRPLQWIFFRESDDFESSFLELVDALDTDLAWLKVHTRLGIWASEWDRSGRDNSSVLRGSDLRTAEEWQVRAADKEPKLTALQTEYMLASQRDARRRQRLRFIAVTFGLIVAVVLGSVALWQRNVAVEQENIASARLLAAQAQLASRQEGNLLQRSVLLAIEAKHRLPFPSPETDQILRTGLDLLPERAASLSHDQEVIDVAFSPNGKYLATASADNTARLWEAPGGDPASPPMKHEGSVYNLAFSRDGKYLATASEDGTARLWKVPSGDPASPPLEHEDVVYSLGFSPNGKYLATASDDKTVRLWTVPNGQKIASPIEHDGALKDVAFSPNGKYLATASAKGAARLWQVPSGREAAPPMKHGNIVYSVTFSPNGQYLASASANGTARLWEVPSGEEAAPPMDHGDIVWDVTFSPGNRYLATASANGAARLWEIPSGREVEPTMEHDDAVRSLTFSADGNYLATASDDSTARLWEVATGQEVKRMIHTDVVWDVKFSPGDKYLATASADNTARLWEPTSGSQVAQMTHEGILTSLAFDPDGKYLATGSQTARLWEMPSGEAAELPMEHKSLVTAVASAPRMANT
jgi:WD40 repeat protein